MEAGVSEYMLICRSYKGLDLHEKIIEKILSTKW